MDLSPAAPDLPRSALNTPRLATDDDAELRAAAAAFEQVFISEMLKNANVGEIEGPFTGGFGEEAFRSFQIDEYAAAIVDQGSFGLAEQIYAQLKNKVSGDVA